MIVNGIFNIKKLGNLITGTTPWEDNIQYTLGQVLTCGDKKWRIIAISHFRQGCFGMPPSKRIHSFQLAPIDHEDQPNIGDDLI